MGYERYRLILRHDMVDEGGEKIYQIEEPLIMQYTICKNDKYYSPCKGVLLNQLMDWFKQEILRRKEE